MKAPSSEPDEYHEKDRRSIDPALLADVAGFVEDPKLWFFTPNRELGYCRPVDMLGTPEEHILRNAIEGAKLGMFS